MAIVGTLPSILTNGTTADATQVMADLNYIVSQVNANGAAAGANSDITSILGLTTPLATTRGGTGASTTGATPLQNLGAPAFMRGLLAGMQITSVGSSSVTISAGVCCDSSGLALITLPIFSKLTTGAWTAGSGGAGLGAAVSLGSSQTLHLMAIANGGSFDAYFDTSPTGANAPSGTTGFRRIASLRTASAATSLLSLSQRDDQFVYTTAINDQAGVTISTTAAFTQAVSVPVGLDNITANCNIIYQGNAGVAANLCLVSSLLQTDVAASSGAQLITEAVGGQQVSGQFSVVSGSSGQIRYRSNQTSTVIYFFTTGYQDTRGRTGSP